MRRGAGLLLGLWALGAAWAEGPAEYVTKEATGEAAIVGGNEAQAEKEAREAAQRKAVEEVSGLFLTAETVTQNSQLLSDKIYSHSAGYVRNVTVIGKKKDRGVMSVSVRCEVGVEKIDKDLLAVQGLVRRFGGRKLVVVLQENTIDSKGVTTTSGVMKSVLQSGFEKDGWTVIDENFAGGKLRLSPGVALGAPEVKEIGDLTKADFILYGKVTFRQEAPGGFIDVDAKGQPLVFYVSGDYELTLFATDNGSVLASQVGNFQTADVLPPDVADAYKKKMGQTKGPVTDIRAIPKEALVSYGQTSHLIAVNHGSRVLGRVREAVYEKLRSREQNGGRVAITVAGLPDYAAVQDFRKALAAVSNVKSVATGNFQGGKLQLDIVYTGDTDSLAGALGTMTFKKKKIAVTAVTPGALELAVGK